MSARTLARHAFAGALIVFAAVGATRTTAEALPDFRVQLFTTAQGTFDSAQGAAPVTAGPTSNQGSGI